MGNKIYGCDECLKACPWNRFARPCRTVEFQPSPSLLSMRKDDWHSLSEEQYKNVFKGSAVKRAKYNGLIRNIQAIHSSFHISYCTSKEMLSKLLNLNNYYRNSHITLNQAFRTNQDGINQLTV